VICRLAQYPSTCYPNYNSYDPRPLPGRGSQRPCGPEKALSRLVGLRRSLARYLELPNRVQVSQVCSPGGKGPDL